MSSIEGTKPNVIIGIGFVSVYFFTGVDNALFDYIILYNTMFY